MLILCTTCKSKYLVNSADLKPDGRTVQCVKCGNQWFQYLLVDEKSKIEEIVSTSTPSISYQNNKKNQISPTPNLPSTYVKEQKVSVLNSILAVIFAIIFIGGFWVSRNLEINNLVLLKFYLDEFIFNLRLIFDDIAIIIHQIFN